MNENALMVTRAFGSEKHAAAKEAAGAVCPVTGKKIRSGGRGRGLGIGRGRGPIGIPIAEKKKAKQAVIEKVSGVSTSSGVVDVDVERVDRTAIHEINAALENLPEPTEKQAVSMSGVLGVLKKLIMARGLAAGGLRAGGIAAGVLGGHKLLSRTAAKPEKKEKEDKKEKKEASAQDTKKDAEGDKPKPGVVTLESASDTPPKKAPAKKPEKEESENKVEYDEKKAAAGKGIPSQLLSILKQVVGAKGLPRQLTRGVGVPVAHRIGGLSKLQDGGAIQKLLKSIGERAKPIGAGAAGTAGKASLVGAGTLGLGGLGIHAAGRRAGEKAEETEQETGAAANTAALTAILAKLTEQKAPGGPADMDLFGGLSGGVGGSKWGSFGAMLKRAFSSMGRPETPLKTSTDLPRRTGGRTTKRQDVFEDLARWSLGAQL